MKINHLTISNVLSIARADIETSAPITLISGDNMAGKTSIRDAISMAVLGTPSRVDKKKDLGMLLHDDAKKGRVVLSTSEGECSLALPKGEHIGLGEITGAEYLPLVIDPSKFMLLSLDERKRTLFELTGAKPSMKVIQPMLEKAGINMDLFGEVQALLRGGFPEVAKDAANRARDAKAAWRTTTGENWGADKSEGWEAEAPAGEAPTDEAIQAAKAAYEKTLNDMQNGSVFIGREQQRLEDSAGKAEQLAELKDVASQLERREAKLEATRADLAQWSAKVDTITDQLAAAKAAETVCECPSCGASLKMEAGELVIAAESKKGPTPAEVTAELNKAREARDMLRRTETNDIRAVDDSKRAIETLAGETDLGHADDSKLNEAREAMAKLTIQRDRQRAAYEALSDLKATIDGISSKNATATMYHKQVVQWLAIADEMGADGIPKKLLSRALDPFNQSLEMLAGLCGWPTVAIGSDIEITSNGRLYQLASKSEQWRADTLIALAIAQMSQLKFVVLDGFDILQASARQELLGMLLQLVDLDAIESVVMAGTMKEAPKGMPEQVAVVWVNNNIAQAV